MGQPKGPFDNRLIEYTSISSAVNFGNPIGWIQVVSAGSGGLVVKDETNTTRTYTGLIAGDIYYGPFKQITSMTCSKIRVGDGQAPPANPAAAIGQIATTLQTSQGLIPLPWNTWYLLTGAPLAIFANGASSVPGSTIISSKAAGIRWNNNATLDGIMRSFTMPPDVDTTLPMTFYIRAAKTGATLADAVTFDVTAYNQVTGALYDADSNFGGTSGAMTGNATAKTEQVVSVTFAAVDLAAFPASVTLTLKPTDGTLGTDDLLLIDTYVQYTKKLLSS